MRSNARFTWYGKQPAIIHGLDGFSSYSTNSTSVSLEEQFDINETTCGFESNKRLKILLTDADFPMALLNDPRKTVVEQILEIAAKKEMDDVQIVIARGLRSKPSESQVQSIIGQRAYDSFSKSGNLVYTCATDCVDASERTGGDTPVGVSSHLLNADIILAISLRITGVFPACPFYESTSVETQEANGDDWFENASVSQVKRSLGVKCINLYGQINAGLIDTANTVSRFLPNPTVDTVLTSLLKCSFLFNFLLQVFQSAPKVRLTDRMSIAAGPNSAFWDTVSVGTSPLFFTNRDVELSSLHSIISSLFLAKTIGHNQSRVILQFDALEGLSENVGENSLNRLRQLVVSGTQSWPSLLQANEDELSDYKIGLSFHPAAYSVLAKRINGLVDKVGSVFCFTKNKNIVDPFGFYKIDAIPIYSQGSCVHLPDPISVGN